MNAIDGLGVDTIKKNIDTWATFCVRFWSIATGDWPELVMFFLVFHLVSNGCFEFVCADCDTHHTRSVANEVCSDYFTNSDWLLLQRLLVNSVSILHCCVQSLFLLSKLYKRWWTANAQCRRKLKKTKTSPSSFGTLFQITIRRF